MARDQATKGLCSIDLCLNSLFHSYSISKGNWMNGLFMEQSGALEECFDDLLAVAYFLALANIQHFISAEFLG